MRPRLAPPLAAALPRVLRGICTVVPPSSKPPPEPLSSSELGTISALLPRLLYAGHIPTAGRLLSAALLLPGSIERLPLPDLAAHLASLPTLSAAFALLTTLRHHPARPSPLPLASPLLDSLLSQRRARDAASVLWWLCRPDSPCRPDASTYAAAVAGFCCLEDPGAHSPRSGRWPRTGCSPRLSCGRLCGTRCFRTPGSRRRGHWRRRCGCRRPARLWSWSTNFFRNGNPEPFRRKNNALLMLHCVGCKG